MNGSDGDNCDLVVCEACNKLLFPEQLRLYHNKHKLCADCCDTFDNNRFAFIVFEESCA